MAKNTIKEGVKGTDNCPICGKTMACRKTTRLGQEVYVMVCHHDSDHEVSIRLKVDAGGKE